MTKLLNRPLKVFALYSLFILLISIPAYVFVVDYIWISELDENNWLTLEHTKKKLSTQEFTNDDIEKINLIWGELQPGLSIKKLGENEVLPDSVYEVVRPNEFDKNDEFDRFRGLKSYVEIREQVYQITTETNVEESDETLIAVAIVTFLFFVILIIGFVILNRRIALSSWKPFNETLNSLKSFDLSKDTSLDLAPTNIQEFQELNQSLHRLVENNLAIYMQQKTFIENASHELQTPIALLKSKLDLLIQEKGVTPQISEILNGIEAPLSRLSRINKNLLVLAKVENNQYNDLEELEIKKYIESALVLFEDYVKDKGLTITADIENIKVNANSFLLETLIHNLLSNAIRHTPSGGTIEIKLATGKLSFSNSGSDALNEKSLFNRFNPASSGKVSSGLGLAIVKEIACKYEWRVIYSFDNNFHTFLVSF